jgi:ribonuclease D
VSSNEFELIESGSALATLCQRIEEATLLAFDTEFVSEDSYRPQLCLLQLATDRWKAVIDPLHCGPLDRFWELVLAPSRRVVVHAAREEFLFAFRAAGRGFPDLFDVQVAAGLLGLEFPSSYSNLVQRYTGRQLAKGHTRSDWRVRPLSRSQLQYAIQDVDDLLTIYRRMEEQMVRLGRRSWMDEEMESRKAELIESETSENWFRVSGIQSLDGRSLQVAYGLWKWREQQARQRNQPARRILRDDLVIEIAKQAPRGGMGLDSVRGMNQRLLRNSWNEIIEVVDASSSQPCPPWPKRIKFGYQTISSMVTQFLHAGLAYICREQSLSPALVGTTDDLRDYALYRINAKRNSQQEPPALLQGWRQKIVGERLDELLQGKVGLALVDPLDEMPLRFIRNGSSPT